MSPYLNSKFKPLKPLKFQRRFLRMAKFQRVIIDIMEEKDFFSLKLIILSPQYTPTKVHMRRWGRWRIVTSKYVGMGKPLNCPTFQKENKKFIYEKTKYKTHCFSCNSGNVVITCRGKRR